MPVFRFHVPLQVPVQMSLGSQAAQVALAGVQSSSLSSTSPSLDPAEAKRRRKYHNTTASDEPRREIHEDEDRYAELREQRKSSRRNAMLPVSLCLSELDWLAATAGAGPISGEISDPDVALVREPDVPTFEELRNAILQESFKILASSPGMAETKLTAQELVQYKSISLPIHRKEVPVNKWNKAEKRCVEIRMGDKVCAEITLLDFRGEYYVDDTPMVAYRVSVMVSYTA
mmetsp:Transcript_13691/g.26490  ORF Transcript_13691/g.26490 Transcript_13691/m.26490 type:complete len:231 (+) Transcript_13691:52-744(+)|eukprot:CAMPEP_0171574370 /NCGR_PEP_ID=MMETSP0961-20121227/5314_1 /TAXON_ID=87120 /ORGANISM="Aurantiochytrium limacinum, Strain ATCCMYA-1381" /LENGTH=230 /DNA_ID=CAMNT_0012129667 /DNA_START=9 /DNA_END=701 /DNA_ORIENTATION=+